MRAPAGSVPSVNEPFQVFHVVPLSVEYTALSSSRGIISVSAVSSASDGPAFDTVIVYITCSQGAAEVLLAVLITLT
jgi:hypothetical protein